MYLTVFGIDRVGVRQAFHIRSSMNLRVFQLSVKLGEKTVNNYSNTKVIEEAPYKHVTEAKICNAVASVEAMNLQKIDELPGMAVREQTARELGQRGWIRPPSSEIPIVYEVKCVEFKRPFSPSNL